MIEVVTIKGKGRGVVTTEDISRGKIIFTSPVLSFPAGALDGTPFYDYGWSDDEGSHLTLGPQTLCNDSSNPNCISICRAGFDWLIAIRAIRAGEELTLCYGDFE